MASSGGFHGRLLRIDLTHHTYSSEPLPEQILEDFVGGRGLGARILYDEVPQGVSPLSESNKIIFSAGPLTGTRFPTSARAVVVTKSPITGGYLYSMAGGKFGLNLKKAGFDSIVLEGKSEEPVCVMIEDERVEFKKASHLWGMKTTLALTHLRERIDDKASIVINGPAGDYQGKMAGLMTDDWRQFGRGGAGAVLGSKNVKAIALSGSRKVQVSDDEGLKKSIKEIFALLKKQPGVSQKFPRYGSGENLESRSLTGMLPTRNWAKCTFDQSLEISMITLRDVRNMVRRDQGCTGCPLQCAKLTAAVSPEYAGYFCDGPEYETLYAFGSNLMIGDPNFVVAANSVCDELGLDTMSAGISIGFAMECLEKGLISEKDLGGKRITFGSPENVLGLLEDMAYQRGPGEWLAQGTKSMSERIGRGSEKFAMQVKGLELGGYDPRSAKGQAVVFAAGNRGGCHHSIGLTAVFEVNQGTGQQIEGKGAMVRKVARVRILSDSLANCTFAFSRTFDYALWSRVLEQVTGIPCDTEKLEMTGDRINTLERMYNLREGFSVDDDRLPGRLMEDPLPDGPHQGQVVTESELIRMRTDYFTAMGWDERGVPLESTLKRLGVRA